MYKFNITELSNGMKIITVPNKKIRTFLFKIIVKTGSEYETYKTQGISHFAEHMFKKGTKTKTVDDILKEVEKYGWYRNASTDSLFTQYFIKTSTKYQNEAVDMLSDIFCNATFPKNEVEKEKGVILSELIRKKERRAWRNRLSIRESYFGKENPGGWPTLGNEESIQGMTQAALKKYVQNHYTASNIIILLAGNFNEQQVIEKIKKNFKSISCAKPKKKKKVKFINTKQELIVLKSSHKQVFLTVAFPFSSIEKDQRYLAVILQNILFSKGLTSRLYYKIREKNSLSYSLDFSNAISLDHGITYITVPTSVKNILECFKIVLTELNDIKKNGIPKKELKESLLNIEGKLDFENDSFYPVANNIAYQIAKRNEYISHKDSFKKYKAIKREELQIFANDLFNFDKMKVCIDGDFDKSKMQKDLKNILKQYSD